jgi:hypothetical protein
MLLLVLKCFQKLISRALDRHNGVFTLRVGAGKRMGGRAGSLEMRGPPLLVPPLHANFQSVETKLQPNRSVSSGLNPPRHISFLIGSLRKTWWPGTELNGRRHPFQGFSGPNPLSNQQLNSSRWPEFYDHSGASADVRLSVGVELFRIEGQIIGGQAEGYGNRGLCCERELRVRN